MPTHQPDGGKFSIAISSSHMCLDLCHSGQTQPAGLDRLLHIEFEATTLPRLPSEVGSKIWPFCSVRTPPEKQLSREAELAVGGAIGPSLSSRSKAHLKKRDCLPSEPWAYNVETKLFLRALLHDQTKVPITNGSGRIGCWEASVCLFHIA